MPPWRIREHIAKKTSIKGSWSREEKSLHINIVHSVIGIKICNFNPLKGQKQFSRSPSNGQSDCSSLPDGNGGNKRTGFNSRTQGNLRILHDYTYCRVTSMNQKPKSGSAIQGGTEIIERLDFTLSGIYNPTFQISYCEPRWPPTSTMSKYYANSSSMKNIRQDVSAEGFSSKAIALLERSSCSATQNHYKTFWRKFSR